MRTLFVIILFQASLLICNAQIANNYVTAKALLQCDSLDSATVLFSNAINLNENAENSYLYRGIAYHKLKKYALAITDFKKSIELNNTEAYLWLSKTYVQQNEMKSAILNISNYLTMHPFYSVKNIISDVSYKNLIITKEWQTFISNYTPDSKQEIAKDIIYQTEIENYSEAHKKANRAIYSYPNEPYFNFINALIYESENSFSLAVYELKKAIQLNPENLNFRTKLGDLQIALKNYENALTIYSEILKDDPAIFSIYLKKANVLLMLNKKEEALNLLNTYNALLPSTPSAMYTSAQTMYRLNEYSKSLKLLNQLFLIEDIKADWFLLRGLVYFKTGVYKYAAADFSMTLDLEPNNKEANLMLGYAYQKLNDTKKACYYWQRAYKAGEYRALEEIQKNCNQ